MLLEIVQYGNPALHEKGQAVDAFDEALATLFEDMVETMHAARGIGLATQQIGRAMQFCVVDLRSVEPDFDYTLDGAKPPLDIFMPLGLCNPEVELLPSLDTTYEEGCLSFPEIRGDVIRPDWIRCSFQDLQGSRHVIECNGLLGRCIQHEVDHLNGILFTDRMKKRVLKKIQVPINAIKARTLQQLADKQG